MENNELSHAMPAVRPLVVDVKRLCKVFGNGAATPVLSGVDFEVQSGEIVALSGPSGSGKSTLLNILGCLDRPTSGTYRLGGLDVSLLTRAEQAAIRLRYIGFVFQAFHLIAEATALENVTLPLQYAGASRAACERRARDLLARVGLASRLDHFPSQLSGGERQRVAIARALVASPRLLLADEPTGALDSRTGTEVMRLLLELRAEQQTTLVLVTHDARIAGYADRRVSLLDGRIVEGEGYRLADSA